jgi:uncharacterized protein YbjT (DUF2867 family)
MGAIIETSIKEASANMQNEKTLSLVAGATGLVGSHVVQQLGAAGDRALALTRRPMDDLPQSVSALIVDYERLVEGQSLPEADHAYICLGSTIKKAGSQEAFRRVDHDYVIAIAQLAYEAGVRRIGVVSAVGATTETKNFYMNIKGEVEDAIGQFSFDHISFVQPGLILGDRLNDPRLGEQIAAFLTPLFNPLLRGNAAKYKSIQARDIAAAMIAQVQHGPDGIHRLSYAEMMAAKDNTDTA